METVLPASLINDLNRIPRDRPVALLMRHSARFPIPDPALTFEIPLTEEGIRLAEELGALLGGQFLAGRMLAAPVGRCLTTVEAIARGAEWSVEVESDERLSHPFIAPVWSLVEHGKLNGVLPFQIQATLQLLLDLPQPAVRGALPQLDVMATHDTVLGAVVACLLGAPILGMDYWPGYLEGLFLWREENQIHARWREKEYVFTEQYVLVES